MATSAIVTKVSGQSWAQLPDGTRLALRPGSTVPPGSEVVTAPGASLTLEIDGLAPITIGENRRVAISDDLTTPADPGEAAIAATQTDSERLLAALDSGDDPFGILEATAAIAGGPGGDDGGGSFTRLLRILEPVTPLALEYPRPTRPEDELPRLGGYGESGNINALPPSPGASLAINPGTGPNANKVWEWALPQGSNPNASNTLTSGQISITATDGINIVTINGQAFALNALKGQAIPSGNGILTIDDVISNTGDTSATIDYTYTLTDKEFHDKATHDDELDHGIAVSVQGSSGSLAFGIICSHRRRRHYYPGG